MANRCVLRWAIAILFLSAGLLGLVLYVYEITQTSQHAVYDHPDYDTLFPAVFFGLLAVGLLNARWLKGAAFYLSLAAATLFTLELIVQLRLLLFWEIRVAAEFREPCLLGCEPEFAWQFVSYYKILMGMPLSLLMLVSCFVLVGMRFQSASAQRES